MSTMELAINYQSKGQWHFSDPVSGTHFGSKPTDVSDPLLIPGAWLLVDKKQRAYAMASSNSGMLIELKRRIWSFFTCEKLSFKYVAPTESAELSGTYRWKYDKKTTKYVLTKKRDPLRRVFATLNLDKVYPTGIPGKMQLFDQAKALAPDHALLSMDNEFALKELDKFIILSTLEILFREERRPKCYWDDEKDVAYWPAQTRDVRKCGCLCHCFPGECTPTKLADKSEEKLEKLRKNTFNLKVREVESEEEELSA
ncbi:predicted protein [Sclerotinia sclerotiorum 1980 UF-70]|uniref:Uncharacterized protein n=2 Tax=Sclerotinia sclerotiorum (strain ATCC 18683 / 1980 / Ss-1) TaxID=665079 RepID=A7EX68_SCLS1|nr:predicted protein [Sclerotinia sclerotiorum 1980 UF-70]APA05496.1 hypothetical protein sscle_01g002660 [Sclerotinia sclerotiorum 1980 UF-70]EDN94060.1 predicted protein [Sclerotinia sclerotiorum 1980 UF-70]